MPAIDIPDPLPPAITPDREVIEFFIDEDLAEFGEDSLAARTWQWVLHGGGQGPISHMDWTQFDGDGPPSAATLAAESTTSEPPLYPPTHPLGRTQPGPVHLLDMHRRTRRRTTTTLPPLGHRPRTNRHRRRLGHHHHPRKPRQLTAHRHQQRRPPQA
jgi:hypothetical protein